jgi:hypothetical protein
MDIGTKIDSLYDMRAQRLEIEGQVKEMKKAESELKQEIINALQDQTLKGAKGDHATAAIKFTTVPQAVDWDAIYNYILETGRFTLLHRRLSSTLWEAIVNEEGDIPGIESVTLADLSITKSSRS